MGTVPPLRRVEVEPVITGPLMTGPLITGPEESPELPELTEIIDGALVIFLCREAGDAGMVQVWRCWAEGREREKMKGIVKLYMYTYMYMWQGVFHLGYHNRKCPDCIQALQVYAHKHS
jgi:hypothetical protein